MGRLEAEALAEPQPERVDGAESHASDGVTNASEQRAHLGGAQHGGQHPRLVDSQELEHGPVALQRVGAEEPERADGDVDARRRLLLLLAQEQKVGAHALLGELSRLGLRPVEKEPGRQLVALSRPLAVVAQRHVGAHPLAPVFQRDHAVLRGEAAALGPRRGGLRQRRLLKRRFIGYDAESRRSVKGRARVSR